MKLHPVLKTCAALLALGVVLWTPLSAQEFAAEQKKAQELLRRVAQGGAPLTDEELNLVLNAYPPEKVEVSLVTAAVVVLDRRGKTVSGLKARDFKIREEGYQRPVAWFSEDRERPERVAVLLDCSGSMGLPKERVRAAEALEVFVREFKPEDRMMLFGFQDEKVVQYTEWTNRTAQVLEKAWEIPRLGTTAVIDALERSAQLMPLVPGERQAILLITDGLDNESVRQTSDAIAAARKIGAPVYVMAVVGKDQSIDEKRRDAAPMRSLRMIARMTGGRFFYVRDGEQAADAVETIRDDLRHQYWIAFRPVRPPDGSFRRVHIDVKRRNATILARDGYR